MADQRCGGFWRRLLAFMIDKTIIYALSLNISLIVLFAAGLGNDITSLLQSPPEEIARGAGALSFLCAFLSLLVDMTYFTWFHGISGQTPGKMLFRLRVVTASGQPVTTGTAFLRWTGYLISGLFFFAGFLWIAFDRKKQGWHDKIAMTMVVCVDKAAAPASPSPAAPPSEPPLSEKSPANQDSEKEAVAIDKP